jgi:tetratricopeptide (TPR) repeat protein
MHSASPSLLPLMRIHRYLQFLVIALGVACTSTARAQAVKPEDAIVLIRTVNSLRSGRGSGFVIGDGSWVVTASHVVSVDLGKSRRASDRTALVYSPWTGRAYEAKVAAVDGVADIALLRMPQAGFPALPVEGLDLKDGAAARQSLGSRSIRLFGFPLTYGEDTVASLAHASHNNGGTPAFVQRGETYLAVLNACPDVQPGWSGGPMVSADRGAVVGVFHSLYYKQGDKQGYPSGSLCGYLGDLLKSAGASDLASFAQPPAPTLPRPPDAGERMALWLRTFSWSAGGNFKKTEEELRDLLKLSPEDPLARVELGQTLLDEQKYEPALKELREAVRLTPTSMLASYHLGRAFHLNYDPKGATTALKAALLASPGEVEPQLALAQVLEENQKADEAEALLRAAQQASPDHPVILSRLARLIQARSREESLKLYAQAADLAATDPGLAGIRLQYARALEDARKFKDAETVYRNVLRLDPQNATAYYYLALLFLRTNRIEDAQIQLNAAIVLPRLSDPMLEVLRALQARINERTGAM